MKVVQFQSSYLWQLYHLSTHAANDLLLNLGFTFLSQIDNLILYKAEGKALTLTIVDNLVMQIAYKAGNYQDYAAFITYAKDTLHYEIIIEEHDAQAAILRLDGDHFTLMCMDIRSAPGHRSLSIRLLSKLPLPTQDNRIEVILGPPPLQSS
jgi:hypothetical protein